MTHYQPPILKRGINEIASEAAVNSCGINPDIFHSILWNNFNFFRYRLHKEDCRARDTHWFLVFQIVEKLLPLRMDPGEILSQLQLSSMVFILQLRFNFYL